MYLAQTIFSAAKLLYYFWQKGLGYILGNFFTGSSGHPDLQLSLQAPTILFSVLKDFLDDVKSYRSFAIPQSLGIYFLCLEMWKASRVTRDRCYDF
jgi:hypothetical protein